MAIADRIDEAIQKLQQGDPVNALIQVMIAIDGTAKKIYPKRKPARRCKDFLKSEQAFITRVATGKLAIGGPIHFPIPGPDHPPRGRTLEEVLYKLIRCSLIHEGTMPEEVSITQENVIGLTADGKVLISVNLIQALVFLVIGSQVNQDQRLSGHLTAAIGTTTLNINNLWGKKDYIYELVRQHNVQETNT